MTKMNNIESELAKITWAAVECGGINWPNILASAAAIAVRRRRATGERAGGCSLVIIF